jgi:hypothetical protein
MDDFERELRQALVRRPAPPSLKRKVMERRGQQTAQRRHARFVVWQALAASVMVAALLAGGMEWQLHRAEDRRRGEEARRQVIMALRITGHALNEVNLRLAAHDHDGDQ